MCKGEKRIQVGNEGKTITIEGYSSSGFSFPIKKNPIPSLFLLLSLPSFTMDFSNDDFLNWVLQQTEIELPQQQLLNTQEPTYAHDKQPAGSNNETMAATAAAPYTLTFDNAQPTPDMDMLFTPQQWDQGIPSINSNDHSPLMQSYHSGSSTSGSSSDSSDKESSPLPRSPSPPATKGRFTSKAALKPFIPEDIEPPTNADHRTMPTTGRLDFRVTATPDYNVSASDLKKMTSKERRQLRNKISARNFRQRRKGKKYTNVLLDQCV